MVQTSEELWLAFQALADTHPHDAHLARWLIEEQRRLQAAIAPAQPAIVQGPARGLSFARLLALARSTAHGDDPG